MNSVHDHEHKCPENALETYKALTKHLLVAYKVITVDSGNSQRLNSKQSLIKVWIL